MRTQWMLILSLVFALITAVFAVINVEPVQVNFLFFKSELPLILVILNSTLLGGLIVGSFGIIRQYKLQKALKQAQKELSDRSTGQAADHAEPTENIASVKRMPPAASAHHDEQHPELSPEASQDASSTEPDGKKETPKV